MPRTRSLAWSQLKIGILTVTALILATVIILAVGGQGGFPWDRYELKTSFTNVNGLKSGAVVRVAGVEVGKVTEVTLKGASVEVLMEINKENQQRVTENSRAMLGSLSLLGEPIVDISASSEGRPLKDHDFIQSARASGPIADVTDKATEGLDQATALLKDIRGGKGTVGRLFTDEAVYRDLQSFIASAEVVANSINRGRGTLGKLVNDPAAYRQLNTALANLQEMTRRINAGEGSIGRLLKDDTLAKSLTSASGNIDSIAGGLQRGEGTVGKLLKERELYDRINSLASRVDTVVSTLEHGQGTAGQLLHDKRLYENMNNTVKELQALIGEIKKDPKKYLTVRVSIF